MTVTSAAISGPTFPPAPTIPRPTSQGLPSLPTSSPPPSVSQDLVTSNESAQEVKPVVNGGISQPLRPVGPANSNILNHLSHVRQVVNSAALTGGTSIGLPSMGQNPMAMHVSNMISSGMQTSVPASQAGFTTGQSGITPITASNTLTGTVPVAQNPAMGSFAPPMKNLTGGSNIGISQSTAGFQAAAGMGQTVQSTGQSVQNMAQGVQNMGQGVQSMGQSVQSMGQSVQSMGQNIQNMGQTVQNMGQTVQSMSQGTHSSSQMMQSGVGMNQNMMNGLGPSGNSSGTGTMIPTPGIPQQLPSMQSLGANNPGAPLSQQSSSALQTAQSKYVKVWEVYK